MWLSSQWLQQQLLLWSVKPHCSCNAGGNCCSNDCCNGCSNSYADWLLQCHLLQSQTTLISTVVIGLNLHSHCNDFTYLIRSATITATDCHNDCSDHCSDLLQQSRHNFTMWDTWRVTSTYRDLHRTEDDSRRQEKRCKFTDAFDLTSSLNGRRPARHQHSIQWTELYQRIISSTDT